MDDNVSDTPPASEEEQLGERLAGMHDLMYERARKKMAEDLGVRVAALDDLRAKAISKRVADRDAAAKSSAAEDAWPEPVDGVKLALAIDMSLRRFVVMREHSYVLVVLWIIGTFAFMVRNLYPLLLVRSPLFGCGKSTLLDVIERLVRMPFAAGNATLATLFRSAAAGVTQLLDELDRWLAQNPEIFGFLCASWQSGRPFVRCNPETFEIEEFPCYGPKVLALIGDVSDDALRSRCIVIQMRRAMPGERAERFRAGRKYPELQDLRAMSARWAQDHLDGIAAFEVSDQELPGLDGRALDNAEALLAVAHEIGGDWPQRCRDALNLATDSDTQDLAVMLLTDVGDLVLGLPEKQSAIHSQSIVSHLCSLVDRPWLTCYRGKAITQHWLANQFNAFGFRPRVVAVDGVQLRGYDLAPIREAIARYLPSPNGSASDPSTRQPDDVQDAPSAQESPDDGRIDGANGSGEGPRSNGARVPPFIPGPYRDEWNQRVERLVADGMDRELAEDRAWDDIRSEWF